MSDFIVLTKEDSMSIARVVAAGLDATGIMDDCDEIVDTLIREVKKGELSVGEIKEWAIDVKVAVEFCKTHLPTEWSTVNENFAIEEVEEKLA